MLAGKLEVAVTGSKRLRQDEANKQLTQSCSPSCGPLPAVCQSVTKELDLSCVRR